MVPRFCQSAERVSSNSSNLWAGMPRFFWQKSKWNASTPSPVMFSVGSFRAIPLQNLVGGWKFCMCPTLLMHLSPNVDYLVDHPSYNFNWNSSYYYINGRFKQCNNWKNPMFPYNFFCGRWIFHHIAINIICMRLTWRERGPGLETNQINNLNKCHSCLSSAVKYRATLNTVPLEFVCGMKVLSLGPSGNLVTWNCHHLDPPNKKTTPFLLAQNGRSLETIIIITA